MCLSTTESPGALAGAVHTRIPAMLQLLSQVYFQMQAANAVADEGADAARWGHHAAGGEDGPVIVSGERF